MPNWVEGNIRFRGKVKDILELLKNELEFVGVDRDFPFDDDRRTVTFKPIVHTIDWGDLAIECPEYDKELVLRTCYIKGTRRNFLDAKTIIFPTIQDITDLEDEDKAFVLFDCFQAAWGVDPDPYVELSKKYNVDIRINAWEKGMEFYVNLVIEGGEVTRFEEIKYDDWYWESEMPQLGG